MPLLNAHPFHFSADPLFMLRYVTGAASVLSDHPQVHHQEKNVDSAAQNAGDTAWRFRTSGPARDFWLRYLDRGWLDPAKSFAFIHCGRNAWVQRDMLSGRLRVVSHTCKLRICPECQKRVKRAVYQRITQTFETFRSKQWRMITLTMKSSSAPLSVQIHNLIRSFRRLRQTSQWKRTQKGGTALVEITRNTKTGLWHPHLHCLSVGTYLCSRVLSHLWRKSSHGSFIVDIRPVWNPDQAAHYVCKYLTKADDFRMLKDDNDALDYYHALKKAHHLITYGIVRKLKIKIPQDRMTPEWHYVMPLSAVRTLANRGDVRACRLLSLLGIGEAVVDDLRGIDTDQCPLPFQLPDRRPP